MRHIYISTLSFLLFSLCLDAKIVTPAEAQKIAGVVLLADNSKNQNGGVRRMIRRKGESSNTPSSYYIFNRGNEEGFVIIAGDTRVTPILAYSDTGSIDLENLPPELDNWFAQIDVAMAIALSSMAPDDPIYEERWTNYLKGEETDATPVITYETAKWGQGYPYNSKCPIINGKNAATGCTATATAILLRYFKYPDCGRGKTEAYSYTDDEGNQIKMQSESLSRIFNWDNLPLVYDKTWSSSSIEEVGALVYLCALAAVSHFGASETAGYVNNVHKVLQDNLYYDKGSLFYERSWYNDSDWIEKIINHLNKVGPLLYRASSDDGGHVFVIDGYDSDYKFHINWGWNGRSNGYYAFPEWLTYYNGHRAAFGLQPNKGNAPVQFLSLTGSWDCKGISLDGVEEVKENNPFNIVCGFLTPQSVSTPFEGTVVAATIGKNGGIKEHISQEREILLDPGRGYSTYWFGCTITKEIEVGDRITLLQKNHLDGIWRQVLFDRDEIIGELPIYDQQFIDESTSITYRQEEGKVVIKMKEGVNYALVHDGSAYIQGVSKLNEPLTIDLSEIPAGEYVLTLSKRKEFKTVKINVNWK